MPQSHPVVPFVRAFHEDLSRWFSGSGDRDTVSERLRAAVHPDMVLIYPSGRRLTGEAFLESIAELFGSSPGFVARVSDVNVIQSDDRHAVVAYVETQSGARQSAGHNVRAALAAVVVRGDACQWRFIQETALPT
ncbi:MAG: DUF4440 domain-containing protein [Myxococcota bacterium]